MEAHLTNSTLARATTKVVIATEDLHKAWRLLSLLLRLGRPAPPLELAFRSDSSPDSVEHLCLIPNSPLLLTCDRFITPSLFAVSAFEKLVSNSNVIAAFLPRVELGLGVFGRNCCSSRKRPRSEFEPPSLVEMRAVLDSIDENEEHQLLLTSYSGDQSNCAEVHFPTEDYPTKRIKAQPGDISIMKHELDNLSGVVWEAPFSVYLNVGFLNNGLKNIEHESSKETSIFEYLKEHQCEHNLELQHSYLNFEHYPRSPHPITVQETKECSSHPELSLQRTPIENPVVWREARIGDICFRARTTVNDTSCREVGHSIIPPVEAENASLACKVYRVRTVAVERVVDGREDEPLSGSICHEGEIEYIVPVVNVSQTAMSHDAKWTVIRSIDMTPPVDRGRTTAHVENMTIHSAAEPSLFRKQQMKSPAQSKTPQKEGPNPKQQALCKASGNRKAVGSPLKQLQCTRDENSIFVKQRLKQNCVQKVYAEEKGGKGNSEEKRKNPIAIACSNQPEPKPLPNFDSFTIKEEEGSGGYGTVYKAQRKNDGVTFAIKCPHANANRHHVHNELKMLERFGGKNFVIKYEGCLKSGNSECLVLEHVEHDRPEVLKKEIDVSQLQWYGYCIFRALAGLHKQGIVHRDVKPGNFLFSRKVNKGYLIDFNLAMDLHQKYGTIDKSKVGYDLSVNHAPLAHTKSLPPTNQKVGKSLEAINQGARKGSKPHLLPKNLKRKTVEQSQQTNAFTHAGSKSVMKSQGADGSGITSAKDATSARTPSAERLREPIPCQGRKELISLVHKAMQTSNHEAQSVPASKRKRIAAVPGKVDRKLVYLTPMPLHSAGAAVAGAGLLNNKGDGKQKREGPCVGTKGFRAPEVLFRSPHQGPKVDIWSAGVTLLYLMIGRTPFTGEPEQNIKEIARLRGSEDLWEVAKLHNRESSFPVDLFNARFLPSTKLREWCKQNTKRPEFFEAIPRSLFDLVDKCLAVNPRLRMSAEEALRHEFFAPSHEGLRKERLLRKGLSLDTGTTHLLQKQKEPCEGFL